MAKNSKTFQTLLNLFKVEQFVKNLLLTFLNEKVINSLILQCVITRYLFNYVIIR